jgi:alkylation response protein AidB-like acyl-CoA dehydrogenase
MALSPNYPDSVEIKFLLADIMQASVLSHMEFFKQFSLSKALDEIEKDISKIIRELPLFEHSSASESSKLVKGEIKSPAFHKKIWREAVLKNIIGLTAPVALKGHQLPETAAVVLSEHIAAANPALHLMVLMNTEISRLIAEMGTKQTITDYCSQLNLGNWSATLSITDTQGDSDAGRLNTIATFKDDSYLIKGTKTMIPAGDQDITVNIVHLVVAKLAGKTKNETVKGLFLVPKFKLVEGKLEDNNLKLEKLHFTSGNRCLPYCCVSYGERGETNATLLAILEESSQKYLYGIYHQLNLQALGIITSVYNRISLARDTGILSLDNPQVRNRFIQIQAFISGLRGAIYASAFYLDCQRHGGEEQKTTFNELAELQIQIMKIYASHKGKEIVDYCSHLVGVESISDDYSFGQAQHDLLALSLLGGTNDQLSEHIFTVIFDKNEGRSFQTLLNELQSRDMDGVKIESLRASVRHWRDYLGGAILLFSEMKAPTEEKDSELQGIHLFMDKFIFLLGDILLGYHLVIQAIAAEKRLLELEVNLFNLQQEAIDNPEIRRWYNKIILAEFFTVNILSQQEGQIPLIQRNSLVALEALYEEINL